MQTCGVKPTKANLFPISLWGLTMLNLTYREDRILALYEIVHGPRPTTGSCKIDVAYDLDGEPIGIGCEKNGDQAWLILKEDLLFDYVTRFL